MMSSLSLCGNFYFADVSCPLQVSNVGSCMNLLTNSDELDGNAGKRVLSTLKDNSRSCETEESKVEMNMRYSGSTN
jgi:hypothetical protein